MAVIVIVIAACMMVYIITAVLIILFIGYMITDYIDKVFQKIFAKLTNRCLDKIDEIKKNGMEPKYVVKIEN